MVHKHETTWKTARVNNDKEKLLGGALGKKNTKKREVKQKQDKGAGLARKKPIWGRKTENCAVTAPCDERYS